MVSYPGARALVVRQTRTSLSDTGLVTFERHVLGESSPIVGNLKRINRHSYHYPNGSEIVIGGLDKPSRIMSGEYDIIYIMEATEISIEAWEMLSTRLRNQVVPYQQLLADCNPSHPNHWLRKRFLDGTLTAFESKHKDNPLLYDRDGELTEFGETYMGKLYKLTGHRKQRLLYGKWALAEGVVFDQFNELIHHIEPFTIPRNWPRFLSIDFGYRNPFCCGWWAVSPEDVLYLYREIYMRGRLVRLHAEQIMDLSAKEKIQFAVCDHDAEGRDVFTSITGIRTVAAQKSINDGIQEVQYRLDPFDAPTPKIFFFKGALAETDHGLAENMLPTCTVEEFGAYVWRQDLDGRTNKEEPIDDFNHGMDMIRYAVMQMYKGRRVHVMTYPQFLQKVKGVVA